MRADHHPSLSPLLSLQDLHFAYPGQPPLLRGFSAEVPTGLSALTGDMGCGKTTLLSLVAGVLKAQRGHITQAGLDAAPGSTAWNAAVFAFDHRAGREDPMPAPDLIASLRQRHARWDEATFTRHVQAFALTEHLGKPLLALSTGTRHKLWLAAALASHCPLTLLDEPTAGLDSGSVDHLFDALAELADEPQGRAVLIASGEPLDEVLPLAASIVMPPAAVA